MAAPGAVRLFSRVRGRAILGTSGAGRPPIRGIRGFDACITIVLWGRACHFSPLQGTAARSSSFLYPPECVEGAFSEVRPEGGLFRHPLGIDTNGTGNRLIG